MLEKTATPKGDLLVTTTATKKSDGYGWCKQQNYQGSCRTGHYNFFRQTNKPDVIMWIKKAETVKGYVVVKSINLGNYKFSNNVITQFPTAVEAKKWTNKEYAHMFRGVASC